MKKTIRKILPPALRAARRNCGGFNPDKRLFASNLLEEGIPDETYLRIINALIFGNGVRKSTRLNRNASVLNDLLSTGKLQWDAPSIKVLDAGASVGMDALGNIEVLERFIPVHSYCLGDLYTHIFFDPLQNIIFDQDENVIQVMTRNGFLTLNFEFKYRIEPLFHLRNRHITKKARRQYAEVKPSENVIKIHLLYPAAETHPQIEIRRINVFEPLEEKYDLILCMNLLQSRYFSEEMVALGNENLRKSLNSGGFLVTGVTDGFTVMAQK